jgi:predicted ATPase/DNA-binding SARP family transcriptional activator
MALLSLELLGPPRLARAGGPLDLRVRKELALLAYLAVEQPQRHSRDTLLGLFWPELCEEAARNNLRVALADLRRLLGEAGGPFLVADRQHVQFLPASDHFLDVAAFRALLAACRTHAHDAAERCDACLDRLAAAAELYRGDFLTGFGLPDDAPFEEWAAIQREQLRQQVLDALDTLTVGHELRGDYAAQCDYGRRQIALDPWRESAHAQLMRGLWAQGQRAAALEQYEACCRLLAAELGLEPSPELTALAEQLRAADTPPTSKVARALDPLPVRLVERPATQHHHNLPVPLSPLIGRDAELAELAALMRKPELRLLTIVGLGGMGKTRLALALAHSSRDAYADGVHFVPLAPLGGAALLPTAIAETLALPPDGDDPLLRVTSALRDRQLLLVLDNFEHLLDGADTVIAMLHAAPHLRILVTSRERLNLRDEHLYRLDGLPFNQVEGAPEVPPAAALFAQSTRRVQPAFALEAAQLPAVLQICRLVEGMPLGLELAAAWMESLTPAEIGTEIAEGIDILAAEWRDLPKRQRSIRSVFEWSWRLLGEGERQVFAQLAVFRGGFTRPAARAVAGASPAVLNQLVQKALLRVHSAADGLARYELHELLRQFALEQLSANPAAHAAVLARHAAFYTDVAERGRPQAVDLEQEEWQAQIMREYDNMRAALSWAQTQPDVTPGLRLAGALWLFWQRSSYLREGFGWLEGFLAAPGAGVVEPALRMRALIGAGWLAHELKDAARADVLLGEGVRLKQALGGIDLKATALIYRALMARDLGNYTEATALLEESLAMARVAGDAVVVAYALFRLGGVTRQQGDYQRATAIYQERLARCQALDDRYGAAFALLGISDIILDQGDPTGVRIHSTNALEIGRTLEQPTIIGFALNNLALAELMHGDLERAAALAEEALALFRSHDIRAGVVELLVTLGRIAAARNDWRRAHTLLVRDIDEWPGPRWLVLTRLETLAQVMAASGDASHAVRLWAATATRRAIMGTPLPPSRRGRYAADLDAARQALGDELFAAAWAEGAAWTPEHAVAATTTPAGMSVSCRDTF